MQTYAVKWREPDGQTYIGRLAFGSNAVHLDGRSKGGVATRQFAYGELGGLRIGHRGTDRLDDRPALVIDRPDGRYQVNSTLAQVGVLHELIDRLVGLQVAAPRRVTIVVPLKEGTVERVRELATRGPPFDPETAYLTRHQLLLTSQEAIFVFEAAGDVALDALLGIFDVRAAAHAWHDVVAGPPRLAEVAYAWERPEPHVVPAVGLGF